MSSVTIGDRKIPLTIQTGTISRENNVKFPVFEVKVPKRDILRGLDEEEIKNEIQKQGVNDVKGAYVSVGSLREVSTSGNWPSSYDERINKKSASRK